MRQSTYRARAHGAYRQRGKGGKDPTTPASSTWDPSHPVALGDYYIGTNHVLPTSGAGRFTAGLAVDTFTKRKSVVKVEKEFVEAIWRQRRKARPDRRPICSRRGDKSEKGALMKLKIGLPKGSLQESTFRLFKNAGYTIKLPKGLTSP